MKKRLLISFLAAAMLVLGLVAGASAAIVTTWDYHYYAGFTEYTPGAPAVTASDPTSIPQDGGPDLSGHKQLAWGYRNADDLQSRIILDPVDTGGTVDTNGAAALAMNMTHDNWPIFGDTLATGKVQTALVLQPSVPASATVTTLTAYFDFDFYETSNYRLDTDGKNYDFFVLDTTTMSGPISGVFEVDGEQYILDFTQSFQVLNGDQFFINTLAEFNQTYDPTRLYLGWKTVEEQSTTVPAYFTVSTIPEPSTFALLGLGILGFAIYTRRRTE